VKRVLTVASSLVLATTCLWVSTAASQETTTTTTVEVTTTTEATTTTAAPTTTVAEPEVTTTTEAPAETTTTVPEEPLVLPGQHVTAGQLAFDIRFTDSPASNCTKTLDLAGGQVNIGLDESGNIGGVYGLAPSGGGGNAGIFMIGLGAVPAGVAIVSGQNKRWIRDFHISVAGLRGGMAVPGSAVGIIVVPANSATTYKFLNLGNKDNDGTWRRM